MGITAIEEEIFRLEEIRVVIRGNKYTTRVGEYAYKKKAYSNMILKQWLDMRVRPLIGELEVEVINGNGQVGIHPLTKLETIRNSYNLNL